MRLDTFLPFGKHSDENISTQLKEYMSEVTSSVSSLLSAIKSYCDGDFESLLRAKPKVLAAEKKADTLRRLMEVGLYSGVLLPFGREDKYELIESLDDIADKAEIVIRIATLQKPVIPKPMAHGVKKLCDMAMGCVDKLNHSIDMLGSNIDEAISLAKDIDIERDNVRDFEFGLLEKIYSKPAKNHEHIRELIVHVAKIADKAEAAADRVVTLAVKYQS